MRIFGLVVAAAFLSLWSAGADAAQNNGGTISGLNFSCNLTYGFCTCDGKYEDCKAMEKNCDILPPSCSTQTGNCYCKVKPAAASGPTGTRPVKSPIQKPKG
jgi:hypothetical protein